MSIWILQPDPAGTCCACGVRTTPCGFCSGAACTPLGVTQSQLAAGEFVVVSNPTGIILKNGGVSTSIIFSNNNSRLQTVSSTTDYYLNTYQSGYNYIPVNYTFEYVLQLNTGEIVTMYTETVGNPITSYAGQTHQSNYPYTIFTTPTIGYPLFATCPSVTFPVLPTVINDTYTLGSNTINTLSNYNNNILSSSSYFNLLSSGSPTSILSTSTNSSLYVLFNYISNGQGGVIVDCSSITYSLTQPGYPSNPGSNQTGPGWSYEGGTYASFCYNFAINNVFGYNVNNSFSNNLGVQAGIISYNISQTAAGITPPVSCTQVPTFLSYYATFQFTGAYNLVALPNITNPTGYLINVFSTSACFVVTCTNNSYIQVTTSNGTPVDLTTRISNLNIIPNGLPN